MAEGRSAAAGVDAPSIRTQAVADPPPSKGGAASAPDGRPPYRVHAAPPSPAGTPPAKVARLASSIFHQFQPEWRRNPTAAAERLEVLAEVDPELANAIATLAAQANLFRLE